MIDRKKIAFTKRIKKPIAVKYVFKNATFVRIVFGIDVNSNT